MQDAPFAVHFELTGWALFWARLELVAGWSSAVGTAGSSAAGSSTAGPAADLAATLAALRQRTAAQARARRDPARLPEDPTVAALRGLFRAAGCDPTRYRPSSEALLRRVLKGEELPAIQPLVDLNNCLSVDLAVPSCIVAEGSFTPPVTLRAGAAGEAFDSLRGPFGLEGKPLLADDAGPFGTPITDSQRVKVQEETRRAWLVAYLPAGVVAPTDALAALESLLRDAPVARLELAAASPAGSTCPP